VIRPIASRAPVAKSSHVELGDGTRIPILYEDRSVLVLDKPPGWMLVPYSWQNTSFNLQAALVSSIAAGEFWARSRGIRFLRHVHRLDAGTTGILLFARSPGALETFGRLFESRQMEKTYLGVVQGTPKESQWTCDLKIAPDVGRPGRMRIDPRGGKEAETHFRQVSTHDGLTLVEAHPTTGRTHQIRLHLAAGGTPILDDPLYGKSQPADRRHRIEWFALRAVALRYADPFTRRPVSIEAPVANFLDRYGFTHK